MPSLDFTFVGAYDDDFIDKGMFILGELLVNEIKNQVRAMKLVREGGGDYLQGWFANWNGRSLEIDNRMPYAEYLEYGTYTFGAAYDVEDFPGMMFPKKKDLSRAEAKLFPKGMQPFAPVRRVLYNPAMMKQLVQKAFNNL